MIAQEHIQTNKSNLLRRVMQIDGTLSALFGALFLLGAQPLATFLGLSATLPLMVLGVMLLIYGADLWYIVSQAPINRTYVKIAIALDVAWVVTSWLILLTGWPELTTAGKWSVAIVADLVTIIAILKFVGLRRL